MTAASKDIFQEIYDTEFKAEFEKRKLTYEHRLIATWSLPPSSGPAAMCGLQEL